MFKAFWSVAYVVMYACVVYLAVSIALSLPGVTIDFLLSGSSGRFIYVCTGNVIVTSLTFLLTRIAKRSMDGALNRRVLIVSIILIGSNLTVLLLLLEYASTIPEDLLSPTLLILSAVTIFIANTLILWIFHYLNAQNMKVIQSAAAEQRILMQAKHQGEMAGIEQELRKFRHDIHSHFQYLSTCLEMGENKKAEAYLRKLALGLGEISPKINTGNPVLDAILNVKSHIADRESIAFDVDAHLPGHLRVSDDDLVIITGNMLDNAIEASVNISNYTDRRIKVMAKINNGFFLITVINAYTDIIQNKRVPWTAGLFKAEKSGLGLRIIAECVGRYDGFLDIKRSGHVFKAFVMIPLSNNE